ncbi:hypothetical protein BGX31_010971 [Mortierella sp. GBA43]|nr:hypothetical protein BGX31_010971 [Mortierella sp. GBA43]
MTIFHMDVADNTVALVTKHCGLQLELVPIIKHVKEMCDPFIRDYDACVMKNQEDPTVCLEALKRLFHCTEEHGKLPPTGPPRGAPEDKEKPAGAEYGYRGGV